MPSTFALPLTWPDVKNAEYEVTKRVLKAAEHVGLNAVLLDNQARVLWASPGAKVATGKIPPAGSIDFLLSLHFESPKLLDVYSYITLWQPVEFYHQFGYQLSMDKLLTHNDLIGCGSDTADAHGLNLMRGAGRFPSQPLPTLYHTLPEPFLEPSVNATSKLMYVGVNWERLGKSPGRFHETLLALDEAGLVDIFGPRSILGIAPWEGFASYKGEIPFDGESVKFAANRSGICLALSSAAHKNAGILSNRLFEGLAGGAAIIASPNAIIDKLFADVVYLVDDSRGEQELASQITEAILRIRDNPAEARTRVLEGQRILREQCSLERSLFQLSEQLPARRAAHQRRSLAEGRVGVILTYRSSSPAGLLEQVDQLARQALVSIDLHVVCDAALGAALTLDETLKAGGAIGNVSIHGIDLDPQPTSFEGIVRRAERSGPALLKIVRALDSEFLFFLDTADRLFEEHLASLVRALRDQPAAHFACSGALLELDEDGSAARQFGEARFTDLDSITAVSARGQAGRFMFRASLLDAEVDDVMVLLDGQEHALFRLLGQLEGPLVQTAYCTYVDDRTAAIAQFPPIEPLEHQQQFIRDRFALDPRWMEKSSPVERDRPTAFSSDVGDGRGTSPPATPLPHPHEIGLDRWYLAGDDGNATRFLTRGFSHGDEKSTWLVGERSVLGLVMTPELRTSAKSFELVLDVLGRTSRTGRPQHCTVALNGMPIAYERVPEERSFIDIRLPALGRLASDMLKVEIFPDHHEPVLDDNGTVADDREIAVRLFGFCVRPVEEEPLPRLRLGQSYAFADGREGVPVLHSGFYPPEVEFTWVAGRSAALRFELADAGKPTAFALKVAGRQSAQDDELPTVRCTVNGKALAEFALESSPAVVMMRPDSVLLSSGVVDVRLDVSHAEPVYDDDGEIVDPRLLGLSLHELELIELAQPEGEPAEDPDASSSSGAEVQR